MKFWFGLLLSLFGGLLGIGLFREWIKLNFPYLNDSTLDVISLVILLIGLFISALDNLKQSKDFKKLEDEQKGRVLKPNQKENLILAFKKASKTKVVLMSIQGDRESFRFANVIKEILVESNWEVDGVWEEIIIGGIGPGLVIREKSAEPKSIGNILIETMNKNNIEARTVIKSDLKPNLIEIIVGSRP
jgi:hypothetical protein